MLRSSDNRWFFCEHAGYDASPGRRGVGWGGGWQTNRHRSSRCRFVQIHIRETESKELQCPTVWTSDVDVAVRIPWNIAKRNSSICQSPPTPPSRAVPHIITCLYSSDLLRRVFCSIYMALSQKLLKATVSFMSRRPSACPAWNNSASTRHIFMKFDIWVFFENLSRKFLIFLKFDKNNGHFTWRPICIFYHISLSSS